MKHTKNILKSLFITVMALSLLAVSCKKDEGGSKPTEPTSVTLDAATLNAAISLASSQIAVQVSGVSIDFSSFSPNNGAATVNATITASIDSAALKTALENSLSFSSGGSTATATATVPENTTSDNATVKVEINAGDNTFADDVKTAYTVAEKVATVNITIIPDKKWNNTAK